MEPNNNTTKMPMGDMALAATVFVISAASLCLAVWHAFRFFYMLINPVFLATLRHFNQ